MEEVNFVLTGDKNYIDPLLVTMTSILINFEKNRPIHFYLIMRNIDEESKRHLCQISSIRSCNVTIINGEEYENFFSEIDVKKFKNTYINIVCYYRLLMFIALPLTVKKAFYVDGDMIVNKDLAWIYDQMGEKDLLSAVVEIHAMDNRVEILSHLYQWDEFLHFRTNPLKYPYFNAGFFLLNVELAREKRLWDDVQFFLKKHPNPPYADQDILNAIIGQKRFDLVKFLPPHYNVFCDMSIDYDKVYNDSFYSPEEISDSFRFGAILHYAGGRKPWDYNNCHYYDEWWLYASKSPAAGNLLMKSQTVHRRMVEELNYVKYENVQLLSKINQKGKNIRRHELKERLIDYFDNIDPVIMQRYLKYTSSKKKNFLSRAIFLLKAKSESLNGYNSDHAIDFDEIRKAIDKADIVSFDIFDTLICRPFANPTDVFRYMEYKYNLPGFYKERINAEQECRKYHADQEDVSLDQIYENLAYKEMKEKEIETEKDIMFGNCKIIDVLYNYAISCGKEVILVSDMYLGHDVIEDILKKCGCEKYKKLYLSSDNYKTKQSGSLFKQIINEYGINKKYLHIGDNLHSDYNVPKSLGMDAFHITKNIDALLESDYRMELYFENDHSIGASAILGTLASFRYDSLGYWIKFGIKYAGPIICGYVSWLSNEIDDDRATYFVARDGFTLQKAYELIAGPNKESHYYYSPRHISNLCNLDIEKKIATDMNEAGPAALSIVHQYEQMTGNQTCVDNIDDAISFIRTHIDEIKQLAKNKREEYSNYVKNVSKSNKIALVDTVTIHFSSQKLLIESMPNRDIKGYYWTIVKTDNNKEEMTSYQYSTYQKKHEFAIKDWDVMEFFITSPEPPILDVDEKGNPIYKKPTAEDIVRSEIYPDLSDGELLFVKRYSEYVPKDIHISAESLNYLVNILCDNPTKIDRDHFKIIKHAYDSENTKYVSIFKQWYCAE